MTQLQKKCLVASSGAHGLLLLAIVVAAVFHAEPAVTEEQVLTLISPRILDRDGSGGAAPAVVAPQPVTSASHPAPEEPAPQPRPAPPPPRTVALTEPKQHTDKTATEKSSTSSKPPPKSHEVKVDLTQTTHGTAPTRSSESAAPPTRPTPDNRSAAVAKVLGDLGAKIRESTATATVVTVPGEGGGEAFVGYNTYVYNAYFNAWKQPGETTSSQAVEVKIVVARDGSIISAEILSRSGDTAIDRSVQRALDSVKQLPAFPETTQDTQRSFRISFSLEAKQSSG